jgi:hypothetical protein
MNKATIIEFGCRAMIDIRFVNSIEIRNFDSLVFNLQVSVQLDA